MYALRVLQHWHGELFVRQVTDVKYEEFTGEIVPVNVELSHCSEQANLCRNMTWVRVKNLSIAIELPNSDQWRTQSTLFQFAPLSWSKDRSHSVTAVSLPIYVGM